VRYIRLFNTEDGSSRFEDAEFTFAPTQFAPPAPPVDVSEPIAASAFMMLRIPAGWTDLGHPAPARQYVITVAGQVEITAGAETRTLRTGDVIYVEDTEGVGHGFTAVEDTLMAIVRL
jgi:hypothetical protein